MKRFHLPLLIVLLGSALALAAGLISKQAAEKDALNAVGGGTVLQAQLDSNAGKRVWSVDIAGSAHEYEVWVDAHTGAILQIITQPLLAQGKIISKQQAEQDALAAVGGGQVLRAALDRNGGKKVWSVDILGASHEFEVWVDAYTGAIVKIITQPKLAGCQYISKAQAKQIARAAVNGGTVLAVRLDKKDTPANWSVDIKATDGKDYEVKVDACTGKVLQIIVGG
jgi:uncharacterized membrane protein YkoI